MDKVQNTRYVNSINLFKFCKKALEHRYNGSVKVIDQDVGAIVGYDPADCSHWKNGKKNIKSLTTIKTLANHLNIDERLLIDLATGEIKLEEALFEYKGYGLFSTNTKFIEHIKKEYFRDSNAWTNDSGSDNIFAIKRDVIASIVNGILESGNFNESPIYLPEVFQLYPNLNLVAIDNLDEPVKVIENTEGNAYYVTVQYNGTEMRPYIRFLIAKEIFKYICNSNEQGTEIFKRMHTKIFDIHANIFAAMLLIPTKLLKQEITKIDNSFDLVTQLANTFWVSRSLMNQRLKDYLENSI